MSRFLTAVIVDGGTATDELTEAVHALLEDYSATLKVEEWEEPCWCVGERARKEAEEAVERRLGSEADFAATGNNVEHAEDLREYYRDQVLEVFLEHPERDVADEHCSLCDGAGFDLTDSNPDRQFDYWSYHEPPLPDPPPPAVQRVGQMLKRVFGGRGVAHPEARRPTLVDHPIAVPVSTFLEAVRAKESGAFAVVTPSGEWFARWEPRGYSFPWRHKTEDEWQDELVRILDEHTEHLCVFLEMHD